jgi:hypothetical protein
VLLVVELNYLDALGLTLLPNRHVVSKRLDFEAPGDLSFFTVEFDLAPLNLAPRCNGGDMVIMAPQMRITLFEDDDGNGCETCDTADTINRGWNQLDTSVLEGLKGVEHWDIPWKKVSHTFNKGTHQKLRIHFHPVAGQYAAIDNLKIYVDLTAPPTPMPSAPPTPSPTKAAVAATTGKVGGDPHFTSWNGHKYEVSLAFSCAHSALPVF